MVVIGLKVCPAPPFPAPTEPNVILLTALGTTGVYVATTVTRNGVGAPFGGHVTVIGQISLLAPTSKYKLGPIWASNVDGILR